MSLTPQERHRKHQIAAFAHERRRKDGQTVISVQPAPLIRRSLSTSEELMVKGATNIADPVGV